MIESWKVILGSLGGSAVLLLLLGWLARSILIHFLSKDFDRFKADLEHTTALQLERARSDLQRASLEHEVRFRQLHDKRSLVVNELYSKLVNAVEELEYFFQPVEWSDQPPREDKFKVASSALLELRSYFERNRILFPEDLAAQLHDFIAKLVSWLQEYQTWATMPGSEIATKSRYDTIRTAWKGLRNDVPALRAALEAEFRKLLAV